MLTIFFKQFNSTYQFPSAWHDIILKTGRNTDQYKLTNLIPDSVYESMIQTRNQYGWSPLSEIHQWFTNRWRQQSTQLETDSDSDSNAHTSFEKWFRFSVTLLAIHVNFFHYLYTF